MTVSSYVDAFSCCLPRTPVRRGIFIASNTALIRRPYKNRKKELPWRLRKRSLQYPSWKELFEASNAVILTEYRGLTVAQLKELRRALGAETEYAVVKNTLAAIAAKEVGINSFEGQLQGPSALAFIKGDLVDAAKGLRDFAKANPSLS